MQASRPWKAQLNYYYFFKTLSKRLRFAWLNQHDSRTIKSLENCAFKWFTPNIWEPTRPNCRMNPHEGSEHTVKLQIHSILNLKPSLYLPAKTPELNTATQVRGREKHVTLTHLWCKCLCLLQSCLLTCQSIIVAKLWRSHNVQRQITIYRKTNYGINRT